MTLLPQSYDPDPNKGPMLPSLSNATLATQPSNRWDWIAIHLLLSGRAPPPPSRGTLERIFPNYRPRSRENFFKSATFAGIFPSDAPFLSSINACQRCHSRPNV